MSQKTAIQRYKPAVPPAEHWEPPIRVAYGRPQAGDALDLQAYWNVIWSCRVTVLIVFLIIFAGTLFGTLFQTPVYRAAGVLEIGKENPDIVSVDSLFNLGTESDAYLQTQFEILKSASLAERVIDQLHLDKVEEFNPPPPWWSLSRGGNPASRTRAELVQAVLARFRSLLTTEPVKGSRLMKVSFDSQDPKLAAEVVNSLFANYVGMRLETGRKTAEWLSGQLQSTRERLETSEGRLQAYARNSGLLYLESDKGNSENILNARLRQTQEELTKAQAARYEKEALHNLVQKGDYGSLPGIADNKLMQDLTVRLADLRREYAMLAATFTAEYPKVKQVKSQIDEIETMIARERQRVAEQITNDYLASVRREELLRQAFGQQQAVVNAGAERSGRYNMLKRDMESNRQLYDVLQQKLKEADVSAGLKAANVSIVDLAKPPLVPERPKMMLNLALAIVVGLGLGVGAAFLQEHLDTTLRTSEDVDRFLDLPALAMIPAVESLDGNQTLAIRSSGIRRLLPVRANRSPSTAATHWYRIDNGDPKHSALAEAFGCLRTSVMLNTADPAPRTLLVSSSQPGEGKTTVAVNLAISLAQLGQRVLLIDADIRRPCLDKALGLKNSAGLVHQLTGKQDWRALVQPTQVMGLEVLTSGPPPANPAELLSSWRMRDLVSQALVDYDFVILDSPALLINAADARILAPLVDGVVLVVRSGATPRDVVLRARALAKNVIGVILNQLDIRSLSGYYRGYYGSNTYSEEVSNESKPVETTETPGQYPVRSS